MERSNQLLIRVEEQPPDDWLVVRGGPFQFLQTLAAGQRAMARFGVPLLSVVVTASTRLSHELRRPPLVRYRTVRVCTVQQLSHAGYVLLAGEFYGFRRSAAPKETENLSHQIEIEE